MAFRFLHGHILTSSQISLVLNILTLKFRPKKNFLIDSMLRNLLYRPLVSRFYAYFTGCLRRLEIFVRFDAKKHGRI